MLLCISEVLSSIGEVIFHGMNMVLIVYPLLLVDIWFVSSLALLQIKPVINILEQILVWTHVLFWGLKLFSKTFDKFTFLPTKYESWSCPASMSTLYVVSLVHFSQSTSCGFFVLKEEYFMGAVMFVILFHILAHDVWLSLS